MYICLTKVYAKNSIAKPAKILINNNIIIIFKVSLKSLFFSKTNKPSPAFDKRPLIAALKVIVPFINIMVIAIDMAQFGIKPINDANKHCKYL